MTELLTERRGGLAPSWLLCGGCRRMVYGPRFARAGQVCPECGWHARLSAADRLAALLDDGSAVVVDSPVTHPDPLGFVDTRPYPDRLRAARVATGLAEAVVVAHGRIEGNAVVVAAMDFGFLGGSLGSAVGEAITQACEMALRDRTPLLLVTASGGARMQEGALSLMQMAKTAQALGQLDEAGILTVSLVTDPTFGGVAASFATLTDVVLAEPGARLGFAGARVIEQTIRQRLPAGFQTAEFLLEHGIIDLICPRQQLRGTLGRILAVATRSPAAHEPAREPAAGPGGGPATGYRVIRAPELLPERDPWEAVRLARRLGRPSTLDYVAALVEDWTELHGDRAAADCPAMVAGLGRLAGTPVALVGTQKGHTAAELAARSYGMPSPAGYRKAARVMRLAAKLGLPVVTLIDCAGAHPGIEAEQNGQAVAIAQNLRLMAGLPVPVVALITGEGGSGGALALAVADRVLMLGNAIYSVISPEGCAAILWKDPAAGPAAAAALRVDARAMLAAGIVDGVVPEPEGGADADPLAATEAVGAALAEALAQLTPLDPPALVTGRRARFRRFGAPPPVVPASRLPDAGARTAGRAAS